MAALPSLFALLASCAPPEADTAAGLAEDTAFAAPDHPIEKVPPGLRERVARGEVVVVLARLAEADLQAEFAGWTGPERRLRRSAAYTRRGEEVLERLPVRGSRLLKTYRHIPLLPLEVSSLEALEALEADEGVVEVFEEQHHEALLTQSLDLIDQPEAEVDGFTGEGYAVAVLDTGLDYTRSAFGSCSSPGAGGGCKVVYAADFATSDGARDTGNYHGTNVAGIVAGVAPGADLIGLDVFTGSSASSTDIIEAIDWAIDNVDAYNIAALNLSLGSGGYTAACSGSIYSTAFASARAEGIVPVAASGNNAYTTKISSPACDPLALSVGAVYDSNVGGLSWTGCTDSSTAADKVTCFSNSASFLDMLAPGALITAADLVMGGTSQAAPHVAGAVAVVRAAFPDDTADEIQERLTSSGVPVTDSRQGRVLPRLDLPAALEGADSGGGISDGIAPTGTVSLAGGAAWTNASSLSVGLSSGGASHVCLSESSSSCSSWESYAASKAFALSGASRTVTVYARFKDPEGDISSAVSDSIGYDVTLPADGSVLVVPGTGSLAVSWSGFSDANSGVSSYKLVYSTSTTPGSACADGTTAYAGTGTAVSLSGLSSSATYRFRVCAADAAGNTSAGATASGNSLPTADEDSVVIDGGADWTASRTATLAISADGAAQMCISNTTSCTSSSWTAYSASKSWSLSSSAGAKTVRVWFRDADNNLYGPVSDSIGLDTTGPTNGALSGEGGDGSLALSWSGFSDASSGVASYKLVYKTGTSKPSSKCTNGVVAYTGSADAVNLAGLVNGGTYNFLLCAVDAVGNASTGASLTIVPAPEYDAPTGSVQIDGGAEWTGSKTVTLSLSASDASTVKWMCISNTTSCASSAWTAYSASKSWSMTTSSGTKTVRVWLKDEHGNAMASPVSDEISLDATAPTNGTLQGASAMGEAVDLSWSGFGDSHTGLASYKLVYKTGTSKPSSSCSNGVLLYEGTATSLRHSPVVAGGTYNYRLCAIDEVGNVSTGAALTVSP